MGGMPSAYGTYSLALNIALNGRVGALGVANKEVVGRRGGGHSQQTCDGANSGEMHYDEDAGDRKEGKINAMY